MLLKIINSIRYWKWCTPESRMHCHARKIVLWGSHQALLIYNDKNIRELLKFNDVSEEEQNRFYNEFVVTNLVLLMLMIDWRVNETEDELKKNYYQELRTAVPKYFIHFLGKINIEKKLIEIWEKLIDLRYQEYQEDLLNWRSEMLEFNQEIGMNKNLVIFQTTAFGLYRHLRRSKTDPKDPLWQRVQDYLKNVHLEYLKRLLK